MSSIIEGYNYDIFISYRQKDNKHDGWVTKFVEELKGELEATFKEDVSVYFDENPHDRLQETHNVDKSLEDKLKCLILIPILSQTYCDPASYAWQYEFLPFLRMVENNPFGKDVKLRSGNVASRILPIRIHNLEPEDVKLFEKETGSVLRAMDFVFSTASGVNRPLQSDEDRPNDNLNKTLYRDQINKVAHAIKEIILGMKAEPVREVKEKDQPREAFNKVKAEEIKELKKKPAKAVDRKILYTVSAVAILVVAAILAYPKIFKRDTLERLRSSDERISVAVMPFQNMTNDTMKNYCEKGIQTLITNNLSDNNDILVRQTDVINSLLQGKGITNYSSLTPSFASGISRKLNADIVLTGNIIPAGPNVRLTAQLINSITKEILKPFQVEGPNNEEYLLQMADSLSFKIKDYLIISILEKELPRYFEPNIGSTKSPDALRNFTEGQNAFMRVDYPEAIERMLAAIKVDSNYTLAKVYLSMAYYNQYMYDLSKKWSLSSYEKRDRLNRMDKATSEWCYAINFGTPNEMLKYLKNAIELDDQQPDIYYNIGNIYNHINQYDKAIPEYEKSLEIFKKWDTKPMWAASYTALGFAYHKMGQYKREKRLYKKAEQDFPDHPSIIYRQVVLALSEGKTKAANEYIEKYKSIREENGATEAAIYGNLAGIYAEAEILNKAEEYYRKALSFQPENPGRINILAYFLIDKNRNANEGIELIDKALELSTDNYTYLHTKGWGLYKQGKYHEAQSILQKSWDLRMEKAVYNHEAFLHLEAAKKAVISQKNNQVRK